MAEGNQNGFVFWDEQIPNGHKAFFKLKVDRLDLIEKTFYPLDYYTSCRTIPTSWAIQLKYERMQDAIGSYTFSINLKRIDSSDHRVKASLYVSFYDVEDTLVFHPISSSIDRMAHDELKGMLENILPSMLSEVVSVEVKITIENCHEGTDWQCASKVNTDQNSINLSKL
ncbi:hypothetical protein AVEN_63174-1 [Araneus ventricosus]|uniref:MATH domain-containing protein n=1 Tax=Araneus ventricosus TaxID=182803 RepID=A0A4Y2B461_ARAVE|nr:hypothetical protein AVEN_63174-1 [Araneus ventricosus]